MGSIPLHGVPPHETRSDPLRFSIPATASPRPARRYGVRVHDAAYKDLFSRPRMVEDLLRGFAAREWSDALDLSTLEKLPAEYVSDDLRRRHGDAVWRVRFRDRKWLYLLVMLEFQSTTDRYMAVRILVYTGLLYQDLIRRGAFGDDGRLPPVLPVVLYNGRPRWTAPVEAADLIAPVGEALAPFQPSQRYFLLDEGRWGEDDLPRRNLAAALVALWSAGPARRSDQEIGALVSKRKKIIDQFTALMNEDQEFETAISYATGIPVRIRKRFRAIDELIEECLRC